MKKVFSITQCSMVKLFGVVFASYRKLCLNFFRSDIFNQITFVKNDLSSLTVDQLLRRDLKVINVGSVNRSNSSESSNSSIVIAMSSVMMSVETMRRKDGFLDEISKFLESKKSTFCFVMGMLVDPSTGLMQRDILIYPTASESARKVSEKLYQRPELKLEKVLTAEQSYVVFRQGNTAFSRKTIMPIIQNIFKK